MIAKLSLNALPTGNRSRLYLLAIGGGFLGLLTTLCTGFIGQWPMQAWGIGASLLLISFGLLGVQRTLAVVYLLLGVAFLFASTSIEPMVF